MKYTQYNDHRTSPTARHILLWLIVFCAPYTLYSQSNSNDSILGLLEEELNKSNLFYMNKESRIQHLRQRLSGETDKRAQFEMVNRLFDEYIIYQYDSAFTYARLSNEIAVELDNDELKKVSEFNLLHCFITSGLFKEGFELLSSLNPDEVPVNMKAEYYELCMRYYVNLMYYDETAFFNRRYSNMALEYFEKALRHHRPGTSEYAQLDAYGYLLQDVPPEKKIGKYLNILANHKFSERNLATIYTLLAREYKRSGNNEKAIYYYALSCQCDIHAGIRQTTSKTFLGETLYEEGEILLASKYIKASLEDANFYNARHRKIEVNSILPIVEDERAAIIENQRNTLRIYMCLLGIFIIVLACSVFIIYKQVRKLRKARQSIEEQYNEISTINRKLEMSYGELKETNRQLEISRKQLEESNDIKDVYISRSLYGKSEYLERLENLLKKVERKVTARQYDDLKTLYCENNIKKERENMFSDFDKTFLLLFPDFIEEFNKLFNEADRIHPDKEGNFTPELRIFALMRLGITENERIAKFLNLTVKTVYSYKYRTKNKAVISNEEFEYRIMRIQKKNS